MQVTVRLLGDFAVVVDGVGTPSARWSGRQPAALVKVLALSPGGRLHRDRVVDALWPDLSVEAALPRLHKAAHYARRALQRKDAVVLKDEVVALFPDAELEVDVTRFEAAAAAALSAVPVSPEHCAEALALGGELLPDDLTEPWVSESRERLRLQISRLLRGAGRWEELLRLDPVNEEAHLALMREAVARGDRSEALRRYARMEQVLADELGLGPGLEAVALRRELMAPGPAEPIQPPGAGPAGRTLDRAGLVERDAELGALETAVRAALRDRRGVVVLVSGEAGAGKSTLVRALLDRLRDEVTAVAGGCDDLLAPRSLGPFRDMAEDDPALARALAGRTDEALPALLQVIAGRPSVVVVEDVHWADDATLDAVRYLARRMAAVPAALVLTFRDTGVDADHPLRQVLGSLSGPGVLRLALAPLSVAAVRRLGAGSQQEAVEIHRVTEGNPFFVTEVLAAGPGAGVPATVRDAVLARLGRLPQAVRTLLERLSVVPTRAERWLAETLAGGDPEVLVAAERSGMILGGVGSVSFRHELARRAIESSLVAGERMRANRQVLDALLARAGEDPVRLVHHAERSGQVEVLLEYGPRVAREAARSGAHRQATDVLGVLLEHRDRLAAGEVADLTTRRAYSFYAVNDFDAALGCAQSAVAAAEEAADPALLADALLVLARVALFACGPARSRAAAERAVRVLVPVRDEARLAEAFVELARAHSNLATVAVVAEPSGQEEANAERALAIGERLGRPDICWRALCYRGDARVARGDLHGYEDLRRAVALTDADHSVDQRVRSYVNAAGAAYRGGRLDDAEALVAAGLRAAADGEFVAGQYRLRLTGAAVRACRGDWDAAIEDLRALLSGPGEPGVMAALARSLLARLLARRGDPAAREVLTAAAQEWAGADDSAVAGPLAVAEVELGWLDGSLGSLSGSARRALDLAARSEHLSVQAELCVYLRRAGVEVMGPANAPGPWAPTLAGRWAEAVARWAALGERYEQAVVLATAPDSGAREQGTALLRQLGARGTLQAV
ncbi:MAG TPA: AAA family ATPase [Mycobacteriales bacterium]